MLASINPNIANLRNQIPTFPICLGFIIKPIKPKSCSHIFCEICLNMWLQKKTQCPICRREVEGIVQIYFPYNKKEINNKLIHLHYSAENLKLDNYGLFSKKCLICNKEEPKEQLIICDFCNYFQSHIFCDPSFGLSFGKYYCSFCRRKFIESLKK